MLRHVIDSDLARVRAFLEEHVDTSLFLLSTLAALGPRLGMDPNSGNFSLIEEAGRIVAVFCVTRRGNLLVQAGGRADLAAAILQASEREPVLVRGVVGEWPTAESIWLLLRAEPGFELRHNLKDILYRLKLNTITAAPLQATAAAEPDARKSGPANVRLLQARDFNQWEQLNTAYFSELQLPLQATLEERRTDFLVRVRSGLWWGAFAGRQLVAIASLNATYGPLAQIGGVYTRPAARKRGLAKAVMEYLIADSRQRLGFERLILFTGEDNIGARRLYESLGFESGGAFCLLLGERRAEGRVPENHKWPGQSGEVYTYEIFAWPARLSPGPGNYIFASRSAQGAWQALRVGESADLSALVLPQGGPAAEGPEPTHVHVRLNFNPVGVRRREVNDLAARWLATGRQRV